MNMPNAPQRVFFKVKQEPAFVFHGVYIEETFNAYFLATDVYYLDGHRVEGPDYGVGVRFDPLVDVVSWSIDDDEWDWDDEQWQEMVYGLQTAE